MHRNYTSRMKIDAGNSRIYCGGRIFDTAVCSAAWTVFIAIASLLMVEELAVRADAQDCVANAFSDWEMCYYNYSPFFFRPPGFVNSNGTVSFK